MLVQWTTDFFVWFKYHFCRQWRTHDFLQGGGGGVNMTPSFFPVLRIFGSNFQTRGRGIHRT